MKRHALLFRVKPGSEAAVASILGGYDRPATEIDADTRLLGTTVFMYGTVVVRVIEFEGDLRRVIGHLSSQPTIRVTEAALNPHLAEPRDLDDPLAARSFFERAMMRPVAAVGATLSRSGPRRAFISGPDEVALRDGLEVSGPDLRCASVFCHGETLVRVYEGQTDADPRPGEQRMLVITDRRAQEGN